MSRIVLRSGILAVLLLAGFAGVGQTQSPVVRAVLLYSPTCSHCHQVMTEALPPLRERYGTQLAFLGGIDKHVIRRSREEIVAELEYKIPPMVRTGGCVLGLDHRIPNGTPLANYRFYVDKAWEIMDREAARLGLQ